MSRSASIAEPPSAATLPEMRAEMRSLFILALPMIATTVSRMAIGFIDFVMVSLLGTDATAAISPSTILVFTIQCLGMGAATSVQTFAAQALGRGRPRDGAAYAVHGFYVAAVFFALSLPAMLLVRPFWTLVGNAPVVREMEISFCRICFWSMGFSVICATLDGYFQGIQRPKVPLVSIVVSLATTAGFGYVLIFGKFGFPRMGIAGSGLATVFGWAARAGMLTAIFLSREFRTEFGTASAWRFDLSKLAGIVRIGGPTALQWVLDIGSWFVFLSGIMGAYGTATMAASNTGLQLMHVSFMPALGIGIAVTSVVGHAIGAGRPDLAALRARAGLLLTVGYMGAVGIVFLFGGRALVGLFSDDREVIRIGAVIMVWAAIFQVFDAMGITFISALRGAGDTRWPAIAVALHCWVIFIGGGLLMRRFAPGLGLHGPWMTCTLYIILLGVVVWRRFAHGHWRSIRLFRDDVKGAFPITVPASGLAEARSEGIGDRNQAGLPIG